MFSLRLRVQTIIYWGAARCSDDLIRFDFDRIVQLRSDGSSSTGHCGGQVRWQLQDKLVHGEAAVIFSVRLRVVQR